MSKKTPEADAPQVSVIVPVYNVERYLPDCLAGLHAQTLADLEILLVDDGSTDGSPRLLEQAAAQDARMRVISKPNGGYGAAVNAGMAQARGRYIGIVESDDLVDALMYEELLGAALQPDGGWADVVKSSYWNYYDLEDGTPPYIERSNLMKNMPDRPLTFNVHDQWRVLFQHPSVWSCIYRRDFLDEHGIRMHEIPGAGWADNPFFYETLVQARTVAWIPGAYYYYRQTNPGSSSYLKDYNMPFDRMAEVRAFLERIGETDVNILACVYNREFYYIKSVLERFGFAETDPQVFARIKETLESMDPKVVFQAKHGMKREYVAYYEDVMGISAARVKEHALVKSPKVSVVLALRDVRPYVHALFTSLAEQTLESFEVLAVDCGSTDRTAEVAERFPARDHRFLVLRAGDLSVPEGLALGAECASGQVLLFPDARSALDRKLLARVSRAFEECPRADMLVYDKKLDYLPMSVPEKHAVDVDACGMRERLMICAPNTMATKALRRSFYQGIPDPFDPREGERCSLASTKAIFHAQRVALMREGGQKPQRYTSLQSALAYVQRTSRLETARKTKFTLVSDYARATGSEEIERGFCCYVVESILRDLDELDDVDDERAYLASLSRDCLEPYGLLARPASHFPNIASFQQLQRLSFMAYDRYMEQETVASRTETKRVTQSTTYQVGKRIADLAPKLLPGRLAKSVRTRL